MVIVQRIFLLVQFKFFVLVFFVFLVINAKLSESTMTAVSVSQGILFFSIDISVIAILTIIESFRIGCPDVVCLTNVFLTYYYVINLMVP